MPRQEYDDGDHKVIHSQVEKNTSHGDTIQHNVHVGEKGSSGHMTIYSERNYSTGTTKEGGHGENHRNNDSSGGSSESSGSGK